MKHFFIVLLVIIIHRLVVDFLGVSFNLFFDDFSWVDLTLDLFVFMVVYALVWLVFKCASRKKRRIFK